MLQNYNVGVNMNIIEAVFERVQECMADLPNEINVDKLYEAITLLHTLSEKMDKEDQAEMDELVDRLLNFTNIGLQMKPHLEVEGVREKLLARKQDLIDKYKGMLK